MSRRIQDNQGTGTIYTALWWRYNRRRCCHQTYKEIIKIFLQRIKSCVTQQWQSLLHARTQPLTLTMYFSVVPFLRL